MSITLRRETNLYDDEAVQNALDAIDDKVVSTYGTCASTASTVAKVVTLPGFVLYDGAKITVKFTYANSAASPTMNVNGTGAKAIWVKNAAISSTYYWSANATHEFVYDGTHWLMQAEDQVEIFNRLTNGGQTQGIYLSNGYVYINASYIRAGTLSADYLYGGTLTLGGSNNDNGTLIVNNASGTTIGRWDRNGLIATDLFRLIASTSTSADKYYIELSTVEIDNGFASTFTRPGLKFYSSRTDPASITISTSLGKGSGFNTTTSPVIIANTGLVIRSKDASSGKFTDLLLGDEIFEVRISIPNSSGSSPAGTSYFPISMEYYSTEIRGNLRGVWKLNGSNIATTSSVRYKHDITEDISEDIDAHNLYKLKMKQFVYNDGKEQYWDTKGMVLPGFLAEDVDEIYPVATIHSQDGQIESWDERRIIPGMLKLIQEQHEEIERLKQVIHVA